jgi:hypothetical protein
VPILIILMLMPWSPPPMKRADAEQKPPVLKPADPFDNINLMTPQRLRGEAERAIPQLKAVRGY